MPGRFYDADLLSLTGLPLHEVPSFVEALAEQVMERYEGNRQYRLRVLPTALLQRPRRTKHHYRRMFDEDGRPLPDLRSWTAETFAAWAEESVDEAEVVLQGKPHNNDPAFDVLSVVTDDGSDPYLRIEQVKVTEKSLADNCHEAARKFSRLERGDYDAELFNTIELLKTVYDGNAVIDWQELGLRRQYRITTLHGEDRTGKAMLTTYDEWIEGKPQRRHARFVKLEWDEFWFKLAGEVYGQLY